MRRSSPLLVAFPEARLLRVPVASGGGFVDGGKGGGGFREDDHPRDNKGEFKGKGGKDKGGKLAGKGKSDNAPAAPPPDQTGWSVAQKAAYAKRGKSIRPATGFHAPASQEERAAAKVAPGYVDVWINDDPKADLQALGIGKTGLTKSFYSQEYLDRAAAAKFQRNLAFDTVMPALRMQADHDMRAGTGKARENGAVVRLMQETGARAGGSSETTFGATTLRKEHVTFPEPGVAAIAFWGKDGWENHYRVENPEVVADLKARSEAQTEPTAALYQTTADASIDYIRATVGGEYKNHDIRTWVATATAKKAFGDPDKIADADTYWTRREAALTIAARQINDKIDQAEKGYVNPLVFDGARVRLGIASDEQRPKHIKRAKDPERRRMPGYADSQKEKQRTDDE